MNELIEGYEREVTLYVGITCITLIIVRPSSLSAVTGIPVIVALVFGIIGWHIKRWQRVHEHRVTPVDEREESLRRLESIAFSTAWRATGSAYFDAEAQAAVRAFVDEATAQGRAQEIARFRDHSKPILEHGWRCGDRT